MKHLSLAGMALFAMFSCNQEPKKETAVLTYPETKKVDTVDTYFGTEVQDPYRWLEDDRSDETPLRGGINPPTPPR